MPENKKFFADISPTHYKKFLVLRGAFGAESNGQAMERLIDTQFDATVRTLKTKGK